MTNYMIFDKIKGWFNKDEAEEIIEELTEETPVVEPEKEEPKKYSFM